MRTRKLKKRFVPCRCKQEILSKRYVDSVSSEYQLLIFVQAVKGGLLSKSRLRNCVISKLYYCSKKI